MSNYSSTPTFVSDASTLQQNHLLTQEELFNLLHTLMPAVVHEASREQLYQLLQETSLVNLLYKLTYGHRFGLSELDKYPWIIDDSAGEFGHWLHQLTLEHLCGFQLLIKDTPTFSDSAIFNSAKLRIVPGSYVSGDFDRKESFLGLALQSTVSTCNNEAQPVSDGQFILPEHVAWAQFSIEEHCCLRVLGFGTTYSWESANWKRVLCHALRHVLIRSLVGLEFGRASKALEQGLSIVVPNWRATLGVTSISEAEQFFFGDLTESAVEDDGDLRIAVEYYPAPLVPWIEDNEQWHETLMALLRMIARYCDRDLLLEYNPDGVVVDQPLPTNRAEFRVAAKELQEGSERAGTYDQNLPEMVHPDYHGTLRRILNMEEVRHAQEILPPHSCIISRGIADGASSAWWEIPQADTPGWHAKVVHLSTQNRHPSVRLSLFDAEGQLQQCIFIGIKGGGLGSMTECGRELWNSTLPNGYHGPIYVRVTKDPQPDDIGADSYPWGGLYQKYGAQELKHYLVLESFLREREPKLAAHIPKPIKLARFLSLPTWSDEGTHWLGVQSYALMLMCSLGGLSEPLAALVTVTPSDVRLVAVVNRIFESTEAGRSNVLVRAQEILSTLRFLYWNQGLSLEYCGPKLPLDACDSGAIGRLLRAICRQNEASSRAIYAQLIEGPFKIMRLVHLEGGHLGGGYVQGEEDVEAGAPNGGALALRNLDLRGGLHDLDWCMYLPFQKPALPSEIIELEESVLLEVQRLEIAYWVEAAYWARVILFGELGETSSIAVTTEVSTQNDFTYFCDESRLSLTMQLFMDRLKAGGSYEELLEIAQQLLLQT
jgi:hypothetical protein